jgi:hypothetical protein
VAGLKELLLHYHNRVLRAKYFGVMFNKAPNYDEIVLGTPDCTKITGLNKVIVPKSFNSGLVAGDEGFETCNKNLGWYNNKHE